MKRMILLLFAGMLLLAAAQPVFSHELKPEEAGYPLRVAAYIVHPVGYILYNVVLRPAHALISQPGVRELVGHKEDPFQWSAPETEVSEPSPATPMEGEPSPQAGTEEDRGFECQPATPEELEQLEVQEGLIPEAEEQPAGPAHNYQPRRNGASE